MKKTTLTATLATAILLTACGGGGSDNKMEAHPFEGTPPISEALKNEYLSAINNARAVGRYCGERWFDPAPPVAWNNALYSASYEHSQDMANTGYFEHEGSNTVYDWTAQVQNLGRGSTAEERAMNNGANAGMENIARLGGDFSNTNRAVTGWLNSTGHCVAIMSVKKYIGMSHVGAYWTLDFSDN